MKIAILYTIERDIKDIILFAKKLIQENIDFDFLVDENLKNIYELAKYGKVINLKYSNSNYDIAIFDNEIKLKAKKKIFLNRDVKKYDLDEILNFKKKEIKFSIIIPNYNNGLYIKKCIDSVINQAYKNYEVYIIDDMSTDNSIEIIQQIKDSRITLIQNEIKLYNGGSRNIGILKAKQTNKDGYLLFIDSDDYLKNNNVLQEINDFIDNEDLITLDYDYQMKNKIVSGGRCNYRNKDELFKTIGCCCAVWCKCFKVDIAPLFEFNTLMEDRNYHYKLINKCNKISNSKIISHIWNKDNIKSITTDKKQLYTSNLQTPMVWNNCTYRHIAGMLDLLNEIENKDYKDFIESKIKQCLKDIEKGIFQQL